MTAAEQEAVTESPASVMRRAAKLMRERAEAVPVTGWSPMPWQVTECEHGCPCIVYHGEYAPLEEPQVPPIEYACDAETPEHAAHIAAWHPLVAADFAAALEAAADEMDADHRDDLMVTAAILKAARTYLGSPS